MSVLISKDNKELIITCDCSCGESCRITMEELFDDDEPAEKRIYSFMTLLRSRFYSEQEHSGRQKAKRIWKILRGKDYCYSDIVMTAKDWNEFKRWVNAQDVPEA